MQVTELNTTKTYSYADYLTWDFEERVEIIKGRLFKMSPAPNVIHQRLSSHLHGLLWTYLRGQQCEVFSVPFDVRLPKASQANSDIYTVVQPDICVVCSPGKLDDKGCIGAPDIVAEILSPGNNKKELTNKYEAYEQAGIREYWIVSPQDFTFLVYTLKDGLFVPSRLMAEGDVITSAVLPGFTIDLAELF